MSKLSQKLQNQIIISNARRCENINDQMEYAEMLIGQTLTYRVGTGTKAQTVVGIFKDNRGVAFKFDKGAACLLKSLVS